MNTVCLHRFVYEDSVECLKNTCSFCSSVIVKQKLPNVSFFVKLKLFLLIWEDTAFYFPKKVANISFPFSSWSFFVGLWSEIWFFKCMCWKQTGFLLMYLHWATHTRPLLCWRCFYGWSKKAGLFSTSLGETLKKQCTTNQFSWRVCSSPHS